MSAAAFRNTTKAAVGIGAFGCAAVGVGAWIGSPFPALVPGLITLLGVIALHHWSGELTTLRGGEAPPDVELLVAELAGRARLPMPKVVVRDDGVPNAYASGRSPSRAVVLLDGGLLDAMGHPELEGALAHELMHLRRRDLRATCLSAALAIVSAYLVAMAVRPGPVVLLVALPALALLGQLALCRRREVVADRDAATLLGDAEPLARALEVADPGLLHRSVTARLLSTHPPGEDRVRRLRRLARRPRHGSERQPLVQVPGS